jgi:hypothetical protein
MNFGTNILTWLQGQLGPILLVIIIIGALMMGLKRQFTALIGFMVFMGLIGAIVYAPQGVVDLGKKLWNVVFA